MKKVSFVFGTRPETIKLAPVILAMRDRSDLMPHVCVTAQHREMLDQMLTVFGITPDVDLNLMQPNQVLSGLTANALMSVASYLAEHRPDMVVVQGDTTTTLSAALAAFYDRVPIAHVEAGLRTWDKSSPFPEEINRSLTSRLADIHFAPTDWARGNLLREGIAENKIFVTGNTVIDALKLAIAKTRIDKSSVAGLPVDLMNGNSQRPLVLITSHRRENFGPGFQSICEAVRRLAEEFSEAAFVYPVHLNPSVREPVFRLLSGIDNVFLLEPLSYLSFVSLLDRSKFVLTDSGGIQEEAPTLNKPVLVMRNTTERPEGVEAGTAKLVGTEVEHIVTEARKLLANGDSTGSTPQVNPFGDGYASQRIVQIIATALNGDVNA
jgi:UDP-N-acetylglucosamine 2-epimerase (non-hydrolysing)